MTLHNGSSIEGHGHAIRIRIFRRFTKKKREVTISFVMSVRPSAWNNSAPTGLIFMEFEILGFVENVC